MHRRAGKSTIAINLLILEMMKPENAGRTFWYIAPTYTMAKDIIWSDPRALFNYIPKAIIQEVNQKELSIITTNNTRLALKGADKPDSLLGRDPYGIVVDETQNMPEELYERILRPILSANGGFIMFLGTPREKGFFFRMAELAKTKENWQYYHLSAEDSGIIPKDELADIKATTPMHIYRQDYLAEFTDGGGEVFRNVREVCVGQFKEPSKSAVYSIGVDLAKQNDFTVVTVYNRVTQTVDYIDRFNKIDWDYQIAKIEAVARKYQTHGRPSQVKVDATGLGDPIITYLTKQGLSVLGVTLQNKNKENLVRELQARLDYKNIVLPYYQPLITELEIFQEKILPSGASKFSAPDIEGGHDDCVMSLCLALHQAPAVREILSKNNSALSKKWKAYGQNKEKAIYNLLDLDK